MSHASNVKFITNDKRDTCVWAVQRFFQKKRIYLIQTRVKCVTSINYTACSERPSFTRLVAIFKRVASETWGEDNGDWKRGSIRLSSSETPFPLSRRGREKEKGSLVAHSTRCHWLHHAWHLKKLFSAKSFLTAYNSLQNLWRQRSTAAPEC